MTHELKILPQYYNEIKVGNKNFELRKNGQYLDKEPLKRTIKYILTDCLEYGLMDGYIILGF